MYTRTELQNILEADLSNRHGFMSSDMSLDEVHRLVLTESFLKKFQDEIQPDADERCLSKFLSCNEACERYHLNPSYLYADLVVGEVQSMLYDCFVENGTDLLPHVSSLSSSIGVGPGANLGCASYDFYTKLYNSPLTRTNDQLYRLYRLAIAEHPTRFSAELHRQRRYGDAIVKGSKLSYVPKTREISRTVCTEPVVNMLVQKWIGSHLEHQLWRKFRINLSTQPDMNKALAMEGSIDGSYGTIDLSSASDSISTRLCELILPPHFVVLLKQARSPLTVLPDGREVELHMISSMGNGFTFPLQTLIFASVVAACYRVLGIKAEYTSWSPSNFAVFGDDIIVRREAYDFVSNCLEMFGFTVNREKSFNTGLFRESCGGDYFKGVDVRGVYCRTLKQDSDVYSILNRLVRWSSKTGVLIPTTFAALYGCLRRKPLHIPYTDGDHEGLKVPQRLATGTTWDRTLYCVRYRYLANEARTYRMPEPDELGALHRCSLPQFKYNWAGMLSSFVGGYIRYGRITVRSDGNKPKIRWRSSSSWDFIPAVDLISQDFDWQVVVALHLAVVD